jgi:hypothetical protein
MVSTQHAAPTDFAIVAAHLEDPRRQLTLHRSAIERFPDCMSSYIRAVEAAVAAGERAEAARLTSRSLECYHYTAGTRSMPDHYDRGVELLTQYPDAFSPAAKVELEIGDPVQRMKNAVKRLLDAGRHAELDRLVQNCTYDVEAPWDGSFAKAMRQNFEKAGWSWALALLDLRS